MHLVDQAKTVQTGKQQMPKLPTDPARLLLLLRQNQGLAHATPHLPSPVLLSLTHGPCHIMVTGTRETHRGQKPLMRTSCGPVYGHLLYKVATQKRKDLKPTTHLHLQHHSQARGKLGRSHLHSVPHRHIQKYLQLQGHMLSNVIVKLKTRAPPISPVAPVEELSPGRPISLFLQAGSPPKESPQDPHLPSISSPPPHIPGGALRSMGQPVQPACCQPNLWDATRRTLSLTHLKERK